MLGLDRLLEFWDRAHLIRRASLCPQPLIALILIESGISYLNRVAFGPNSLATRRHSALRTPVLLQDILLIHGVVDALAYLLLSASSSTHDILLGTGKIV